VNYTEYKQLHDRILNREIADPLYERNIYIDYVKLSKTRLERWEKRLGQMDPLAEVLPRTNRSTHWIIITEPWCGDAAHAIPFIMEMIREHPGITYEIQLRDSEPFLIDQYLTNGSKNIPKLIVRDLKGYDLFTWGPRPMEAQKLFETLRDQQESRDKINIAIQKWYYADKGKAICEEIARLWEDMVLDPQPSLR